MQPCDPRLSELITAVHRGTISEAELAKLVQSSATIVQAYLGHIRSSVFRVCSQHGLSLSDLAHDCVADAFARDSCGQFFRFQRFVQSLDVPLPSIDATSLFVAYKSFLTRFADAQLARLFTQTDPIGSKIHRNIKLCVCRQNQFRLQQDHRGYWLTPASRPANDHLDEFLMDELARRFAGSANRNGNVAQLLGILHAVLIEQDEYCRSVTLFDVVQLFRAYYVGVGNGEVEDVTPSSDLTEAIEQSELEHVRMEVEQALKEKIVVGYLAKGKVDRRMAEAMANTLHDLIDDWMNSNDQLSLYEYMSRHCSISKADYEERMRSKMEYLLKLAREEFSARLERNI